MNKSFVDLLGRVDDRLEKSVGDESDVHVPATVLQKLHDLGRVHAIQRAGRENTEMRNEVFTHPLKNHVSMSVVTMPRQGTNPSLHTVEVDRGAEGKLSFTHRHTDENSIVHTHGPMSASEMADHLGSYGEK